MFLTKVKSRALVALALAAAMLLSVASGALAAPISNHLEHEITIADLAKVPNPVHNVELSKKHGADSWTNAGRVGATQTFDINAHRTSPLGIPNYTFVVDANSGLFIEYQVDGGPKAPLTYADGKYTSGELSWPSEETEDKTITLTVRYNRAGAYNLNIYLDQEQVTLSEEDSTGFLVAEDFTWDSWSGITGANVGYRLEGGLKMEDLMKVVVTLSNPVDGGIYAMNTSTGQMFVDGFTGPEQKQGSSPFDAAGGFDDDYWVFDHRSDFTSDTPLKATIEVTDRWGRTYVATNYRNHP